MFKKSFLRFLAIFMLVGLFCCAQVMAQEAYTKAEQARYAGEPGEAETGYTIAPEVKSVIDQLLANPTIAQGLEFLKSDQGNRVAEQIAITEIPASPFNEDERAKDYARRFTELGLENVSVDQEGNAIGYWKGSGNGPLLVVAAHLDTVFPLGYDTKVTKDEKGLLHAPGICDDSCGLAALLSIVRAFKAAGIKTVGDIMFVGDVGEEGRGDLRGVKYLFSAVEGIDGFISIDGGGAGDITYLGLGSKRFEFAFNGPGGHSFSAFGEVPSPIHAMGRAISKIADMEVPEDPRTTFTVSVVNGGTSVNSIAANVVMQTDTRSVSPEQLDLTVSELVNYARMGVVEENLRWAIPWDSKNNITLDITLVGDRPSGSFPADATHVQVAYAAAQALGQTPTLEEASSTDSNLPISLGVPSLTIGGGGKGSKAHAPDEYYDPTDAYLGAQYGFLTTLSLVGVDGVTQPLLKENSGYTYEFSGVPVPDMYKK
ncbi:peptidase M20 [Candidatus Vecturithrix granuli]|uniref:Peptidase M20 n=1 Tax=Vecturithrix granuli TaxID=1499967 RepID=A0A081C8P0_VECG1|nr:peptidase M20 [Candidatus Vecturithrix granuli]